MSLSSQCSFHDTHDVVESKKPPFSNTSIAVHMPEIISVIFSFLNQFSLSTIVRYVCKQWLAVANPLVHIRAHWRNWLTPAPNHTILLDRLSLVNDLQITFHHLYQLHGESDLYDSLIEKIEIQRQKNQLSISKLTLTDINFSITLLNPMLALLCNLTELNIVRLENDTLHLGNILTLCPRLRHVSIDCCYWILPKIEHDTTFTPYSPILGPNQYEIESLHLSGVKMVPDRLYAIVEKCPMLRTLKLAITSELYPFRRSVFYAALAVSCPHLKYVHFSVLTRRLDLHESLALIDTFFPKVEIPTTIESQHYYNHKQRRAFLNTISVIDADLNENTSATLLAPFLDVSYNNIVTSLEIIQTSTELDIHFIGRLLHAFLCSAPSLLHLLAPNIAYFAVYLDPRHPISSEGHYYPPDCPAQQLLFGVKKDFWACRGLQTLQLAFMNKDTGDSLEDGSAENARILFGYITKACPDLRELAITRQELELKLDGGMCLLSRLQSLQKLKITTWKVTRLDWRDIEWMGQRPSKEVYKRSSMSHQKHHVEAKSNESGIKDESSKRDLRIEDFMDIGSVEDLMECKKNLEQGLDGEGCWPMLESICMDLRQSADPHFLSMLSVIRPGVEHIVVKH